MSRTFGKQGAKRQSFFKASPRALLREIVIGINARIPDDLERTLRAFKKALDHRKDREDILEPIIAWWVTNAFRSIIKEDRLTEASRKKRAADFAARKAELSKKLTSRLLELVMPNGKVLGDCTGADVRNLADGFGGLFAIIADIVPSDVKVRDVCSNNDLQKFWKIK